jgi:hypothetical protein
MAVTHNANIRDYADFLRSHPDEIRELVRAFLIKVTGFFRDPEAFESIKINIIPELIERSRGNGRTLRLWSAGCATGEEAYSLALLIADHLGTEFPEWNVKVFATDLAADAIAFARRGLYPENVLSDLPDDYRDRFFERVDQGYRVSKALRQVVIFGQQDISRGRSFSSHRSGYVPESSDLSKAGSAAGSARSFCLFIAPVACFSFPRQGGNCASHKSNFRTRQQEVETYTAVWLVHSLFRYTTEMFPWGVPLIPGANRAAEPSRARHALPGSAPCNRYLFSRAHHYDATGTGVGPVVRRVRKICDFYHHDHAGGARRARTCHHHRTRRNRTGATQKTIRGGAA